MTFSFSFFTGTLPAIIENFTSVRNFDIHDNSLEGEFLNRFYSSLKNSVVDIRGSGLSCFQSSWASFIFASSTGLSSCASPSYRPTFTPTVSPSHSPSTGTTFAPTYPFYVYYKVQQQFATAGVTAANLLGNVTALNEMAAIFLSFLSPTYNNINPTSIVITGVGDASSGRRLLEVSRLLTAELLVNYTVTYQLGNVTDIATFSYWVTRQLNNAVYANVCILDFLNADSVLLQDIHCDRDPSIASPTISYGTPSPTRLPTRSPSSAPVSVSSSSSSTTQWYNTFYLYIVIAVGGFVFILIAAIVILVTIPKLEIAKQASQPHRDSDFAPIDVENRPPRGAGGGPGAGGRGRGRGMVSEQSRRPVSRGRPNNNEEEIDFEENPYSLKKGASLRRPESSPASPRRTVDTSASSPRAQRTAEELPRERSPVERPRRQVSSLPREKSTPRSPGGRPASLELSQSRSRRTDDAEAGTAPSPRRPVDRSADRPDRAERMRRF